MTSQEYDDLNKPVTDFFSKPFPAKGLVKVGTETKSPATVVDTLTLKTTSQRSFGKSGEEIHDITVEPKVLLTDLGVTLEGKFQTQNYHSFTASKTGVAKGLKLTTALIRDLHAKTKAQQTTLQLATEFTHDKFFFKVAAGVPLLEGKSEGESEVRPFPIDGSFFVQPVEKVFVGAKYKLQYATGDNGSFSAQEVEFKVTGSKGNSQGFVTGTLDRKASLGLTHKLNDNDSVGVLLKSEFPVAPAESAEKDQVFPSLSVDVAAQRKVSACSTFQGKLTFSPPLGNPKKLPGIRLGFGTTKELFTGVSATLGADVNVGGFLGNGGDNHSFGFELKFK